MKERKGMLTTAKNLSLSLAGCLALSTFAIFADEPAGEGPEVAFEYCTVATSDRVGPDGGHYRYLDNGLST